MNVAYPKKKSNIPVDQKHLFRKMSWNEVETRPLKCSLAYIAPHFRLFLAICTFFMVKRPRGLQGLHSSSPPWPQASPPPLLRPPTRPSPARGRHLGELWNCFPSPLAAHAQHQNAPVNTSAIIVNVKQLPGAWRASPMAPSPSGSAVRPGRPRRTQANTGSGGCKYGW